MFKVCKKCKDNKSLLDFPKHKKMLDGHLHTCKLCIKEYKAEYFILNKHTKIKEYKIKNRPKINAAKRSEKYKKIRNIGRRSRYKNDIQYKLSCVLRSRLKAALKGKSKGIKTLESIGCSIQYLIKHLESEFKPGMSWDNYGDWHIDHIRPISSFNLPNEITLANHYSNLQPMWAEENLKKGAKYVSNEEFQSF